MSTDHRDCRGGSRDKPTRTFASVLRGSFDIGGIGVIDVEANDAEVGAPQTGQKLWPSSAGVPQFVQYDTFALLVAQVRILAHVVTRILQEMRQQR